MVFLSVAAVVYVYNYIIFLYPISAHLFAFAFRAVMYDQHARAKVGNFFLRCMYMIDLVD